MSVLLGDVCSHIVDCEHKTAPIDPKGGYFAVGTPAMRGNQIDYAEARRISKATFESWTRRLTPKSGDLLFAREAPVGPIVRIPREANVAPGQRTVLLRPDPTKVDAEFLYYLLGSSAQQARFLALAEGSTVPHLNVPEIRAFALPPLPSLAEQHAIADVLGALDDKIAANTRLVATADQLAGLLLRQAIKPGSRARLGDVATITMGSSPTGDTLNEAGVGAVFYQGVRDFGTRFPTRRVWTTGPTRWAETGDILMSVRAPVGESNIAPERVCVGRGLAAVRAKDGRQATLFHLLRSDASVWEPFEAEGTVFGSINRAQLHALSIPTVSASESEALEERLTAIEAAIASSLRENAELAATRDALLPGLMSGMVRVHLAEHLASEAGA